MALTLAATTAADTTVEFAVTSLFPAKVSASGLSTGESIDIEMKIVGVYSSVKTVVDFDTPATLVIAPGEYRLNKPITAAAVALEVDLAYDSK